MIGYKLTDQKGQTRGPTLWGPGISISLLHVKEAK